MSLTPRALQYVDLPGSVLEQSGGLSDETAHA